MGAPSQVPTWRTLLIHATRLSLPHSLSHRKKGFYINEAHLPPQICLSQMYSRYNGLGQFFFNHIRSWRSHFPLYSSKLATYTNKI